MLKNIYIYIRMCTRASATIAQQNNNENKHVTGRCEMSGRMSARTHTNTRYTHWKWKEHVISCRSYQHLNDIAVLYGTSRTVHSPSKHDSFWFSIWFYGSINAKFSHSVSLWLSVFRHRVCACVCVCVANFIAVQYRMEHISSLIFQVVLLPLSTHLDRHIEHTGSKHVCIKHAISGTHKKKEANVRFYIYIHLGYYIFNIVFMRFYFHRISSLYGLYFVCLCFFFVSFCFVVASFLFTYSFRSILRVFFFCLHFILFYFI